MEVNYRILFLIIGIAVVLYTFMSLQFLLGIIATVIIIIAILVFPAAEQWIKTQ
jgi:hypothetical protein